MLQMTEDHEACEVHGLAARFLLGDDLVVAQNLRLAPSFDVFNVFHSLSAAAFAAKIFNVFGIGTAVCTKI